jgi:hypothetical protein
MWTNSDDRIASAAMGLAEAEKRLLRALANGRTLKSHRYLDGTKAFILHSLDGAQERVAHATVKRLVRRRLFYSNQKFPAATYALTEEGQRAAARLDEQSASET